MKTTITRIAIATLVLLLGLTISSKAQNYYDVYLCDNATVKLHMPEEEGLTTGDKVHWFLDGVAVGTPKEFTGVKGSTDIDVPANLTTGLHKYTTSIQSVEGCLGLLSEPFNIYKLPSKLLALTKDRATYCGADSGPHSGSVITATTTPDEALPPGFEYEYEWSVTKNGNAFTPLSDIGSSDGSKTAKNVFTMTVKDAGAYEFNATVKYVKLALNTGVFRSGDSNGCSVAATAKQQVIVTPKPGKPTISLAN